MDTGKRIDRETIRKFADKRSNTDSAGTEGDKTGSSIARTKVLGIEDLVGLDSVKETIDIIGQRIIVERELTKRGLGIDPGPMNFVFTGNPGTAKTTVAGLIANDFYNRGIIPINTIIHAGRKDVIGKYEGYTTSNMKKAFKNAEGGVLFIDEAYSLVERWGGSNSAGYGKEAIDVIVEELGVPRSDRVVILAGYPKEMDDFIRTNPGLSSRLNYRVDFPDYDPDELFLILETHAASKGLVIDKNVKSSILPKFEIACKIEGFGNGRFAVNLLNKAINRQRSRLYKNGLASITDSDAVILKSEDFCDIDSMIEMIAGGSIDTRVRPERMARIGFNVG